MKLQCIRYIKDIYLCLLIRKCLTVLLQACIYSLYLLYMDVQNSQRSLLYFTCYWIKFSWLQHVPASIVANCWLSSDELLMSIKLFAHYSVILVWQRLFFKMMKIGLLVTWFSLLFLLACISNRGHNEKKKKKENSSNNHMISTGDCCVPDIPIVSILKGWWVT